MKFSILLLLIFVVSCNKVGFEVNMADVPTEVPAGNNNNTEVETIATPDPKCALAQVGATFHDGVGSNADPFLVCTTTQWNAIDAYCRANADCNGVEFKVGAPLTFSNLDTSGNLSALTAADNNVTTIENFAGSMNGGDHVINGVILVGNGSLPTGLIANYIGTDGSLSHFKIKNSYFNSAGATYCASLLAYGAPNVLNNLTVEDILISKNVLVGTSFVAGVIGQANVQVSLTMKRISVDTKVTGTNEYLGSVMGMGQYLTMETVSAKGEVTGTNYLGGVVGFALNQSSIKKVKSTVKVTGNRSVGGFVGFFHTVGAAEEIEVIADVTGVGGAVGGLIGQNSSTMTLKKASFKGTVTSSGNESGGLIGLNTTSLTLEKISVDAVVTGDSYVAGMNGANHSATTASEVTVKATATGTGSYVAGVFGMNTSSSSVTDFDVTATVSGIARVGGMVGENNGPLTTSDVDLTSHVTIKGANSFGGFAGQSNTTMNISNLDLKTTIVQDASVASVEYIGGVIGQNNANPLDFNGGTIDIDLTLLTGTSVLRTGSFIGFNTGTTRLLNFDFRSVARTTGPVTCGYVSSLYGGDVSSGSNTSANAFSLNFMNFSCI